MGANQREAVARFELAADRKGGDHRLIARHEKLVAGLHVPRTFLEKKLHKKSAKIREGTSEISL